MSIGKRTVCHSLPVMQEVSAAEGRRIVRSFCHLIGVVVGTNCSVVHDNRQRLSSIASITERVNNHLTTKELGLAHVESLCQNFNISVCCNVCTKHNADTLRRSPSSQRSSTSHTSCISHLLISVVRRTGELELQELCTSISDNALCKFLMSNVSSFNSGRADIAIVDSLTNQTLHQLELVNVVTTGQGVQNHAYKVVEGLSVQESTSQLLVINSDLILVLTITAVVDGLDIGVCRRKHIAHCGRIIRSSHSRVCNGILYISAVGDVNTLKHLQRILIDHVVRFLKQNAVYQTRDKLIHVGSVTHDCAASRLQCCSGSQRNVFFQGGAGVNYSVNNVNSSCHIISSFQIKSPTIEQSIDGVRVILRSNRVRTISCLGDSYL
nr:MAG TPA: hypothetical protein [Caudoviricetes sp.]